MNVIGIQGSPSPVSRSASLLRLARSRLAAHALSYRGIAVRDLPAEALLHGQLGHPLLRQAVDAVAAADLVLVATPIYKAAYSGVLKAFLDLLPQDALHGKTVLPLATGGSLAHLLAVDYALKPVLSALGARDVLDAVYAVDAHFVAAPHEAPGYAPTAELRDRVDAALRPLNARRAGSPLAVAA